MNLQEFERKRNWVAQQYDLLNAIAENLQIEKIKQEIKENKEMMEQDHFNLVVVGEFSRGKSTFINALLGKKLLPSSARPTTALITKISYAETAKFQVSFRNQKETQTITEEEFKELTAGVEPDAENQEEMRAYIARQKYLKNIAYIDIKYPLDLCKNGVNIVDTPGTNDLDAEREEITYGFIPKADAAIFLLSAKQIFSESERQFLENTLIESCIQKIFFAINYADSLKTEIDREKVINYAHEHLDPLTKNPKIFLVSSKQALDYKRTQAGEQVKTKKKIIDSLDESGFTSIEQELSRYLVQESGQTKLKKYVKKANQMISRIEKDTIALRIATAAIGAEELQIKFKSLQPAIQITRENTLNALNELEIRLKNLKDELATGYEIALRNVERSVITALDGYDGALTQEAFKKFVNEIWREKQQTADRTMRKQENIKKQEIFTNFCTKTKKIWMNMENDFEKSLACTKSGIQNINSQIDIEHDLELTDDSDKFIALGAVVLCTAIFGPIGLAVGAFFKSIFSEDDMSSKERKRSYAIEQVKKEVEKYFSDNMSKRKSHFEEEYTHEIQELLTTIQREMNNRIADMEMQLCVLVEEKRKKETDANLEIRHMEQCKGKLYLIQRTLEGIYHAN